MSVLLGTQRRGAFGWSTGNATFADTNPPSPTEPQKWSAATMEASLQKVAIWGCVNLTATMSETMPGDVFTGDEKTPRKLPTWLADLGGEGHGLGDWLSQFIISAMLRGNVVGEVVDRDRVTGKPRQIVPAHPDKVRTDRDQKGNVGWYINGKYTPAARIWHRRFYPTPGQAWGMSPISAHALTIGTGLMALEFGSKWFTEGAVPSGVLVNDEVETVGNDDAKRLKARFMAAQRGTREPAVMAKGWRYQQIQIAPGESQFLETLEYSSAECCRIFGPAYAEVLGYNTGGSLTYNNVEQSSLNLLAYAVNPWFVRLERAIDSMLPDPRCIDSTGPQSSAPTC